MPSPIFSIESVSISTGILNKREIIYSVCFVWKLWIKMCRSIATVSKNLTFSEWILHITLYTMSVCDKPSDHNLHIYLCNFCAYSTLRSPFQPASDWTSYEETDLVNLLYIRKGMKTYRHEESPVQRAQGRGTMQGKGREPVTIPSPAVHFHIIIARASTVRAILLRLRSIPLVGTDILESLHN